MLEFCLSAPEDGNLSLTHIGKDRFFFYIMTLKLQPETSIIIRYLMAQYSDLSNRFSFCYLKSTVVSNSYTENKQFLSFTLGPFLKMKLHPILLPPAWNTWLAT